MSTLDTAYTTEYKMIMAGIILIVCGPPIALWGGFYARYFSAFFMWGLCTGFMIFLFTAFGLTETTAGLILSLVFAVIIGAAMGCLLRRWKRV